MRCRSRGQKWTNPAASFGKFCQRRGRGLKVILSFSHFFLTFFFSSSTSFSSFFFFFFFSLVFARSLVVGLADELHGCRQDLYMMILSFFLMFYFLSLLFLQHSMKIIFLDIIFFILECDS